MCLMFSLNFYLYSCSCLSWFEIGLLFLLALVRMVKISNAPCAVPELLLRTLVSLPELSVSKNYNTTLLIIYLLIIFRLAAFFLSCFNNGSSLLVSQPSVKLSFSSHTVSLYFSEFYILRGCVPFYRLRGCVPVCSQKIDASLDLPSFHLHPSQSRIVARFPTSLRTSLRTSQCTSPIAVIWFI